MSRPEAIDALDQKPLRSSGWRDGAKWQASANQLASPDTGAMPTYVLTCETCGDHQSFIVHQDQLADLKKKDPIQKRCASCRTMTHWRLAYPERRSGRDRRQTSSRRSPGS